MCKGVFPACMFMYHICAGVCWAQKRASDTLGWGLQMAGSYHVGTGNRTKVLRKTYLCSYCWVISPGLYTWTSGQFCVDINMFCKVWMEVFISAHNFSSLGYLCGKQLIFVMESPSCDCVTISFLCLCASEVEVLCSPVICLLITILRFVSYESLVQWLEIKLGCVRYICFSTKDLQLSYYIHILFQFCNKVGNFYQKESFGHF